MYDIIEKKREGLELTNQEISFFVEGYTNGTIPDYQVSALLMAIYFQGMNTHECVNLTLAMVHSGETVDLSGIQGIKVDKHSTGGVGDTTTLVLAPLVASCGVSVAKMSGRGLGHTGGTIDKLEAIRGFHAEITNKEFIRLVNQNHLAVISQSERLVPADKLLYGLRDVTATVNSIPLIASSIMSKKIASGADAIVLDVKTGKGAFMERQEEARELAKMMVTIGEEIGRRTVAVMTSMEQPLGSAVGNALEIREAIETLRGDGPKDLTELVLELAGHMLLLAGKAETMAEAKITLWDKINSGAAMASFQKFIAAQGGDPSVVDDPKRLPQAEKKEVIVAEESGYIAKLVANKVGKAALLLGAGRETKATEIDLAVGVLVHKKIGDYVSKGEPIFTLHMNKGRQAEAKELLKESISVSSHQKSFPLILETIGGNAQ